MSGQGSHLRQAVVKWESSWGTMGLPNTQQNMDPWCNETFSNDVNVE